MAAPSGASKSAGKMAEAAAAFLATLTPEQRSRATFEFGSDERYDWHYVPRARNGLPRGDMDGGQLKAAAALVSSGLNENAAAKTEAIIQHETVLKGIERGRGVERFARDPGLYFFSVFGEPGGEEPWGWRVEGHHVSLNFTIVDGQVRSSTPAFLGANPAEVKHGPQKGLRILQQEEDLARDMLLSLEPHHRQRAVIYPVAPAELITRASRRVEIAEPAGLPAGLMSADQRERLMSLLKVYLQRTAPDVGRASLDRVEREGVTSIFFAWAGSESRNQKHYYRLHGPSLFIEYDNTQDDANHAHSVWRDVRDDFGFDALRAHYEQHHA